MTYKPLRAYSLDAFSYEVRYDGRPIGLAEQIKPRKWRATPTTTNVGPEMFSAKRSAEAWLARVHEGKSLPPEASCGWDT